MKFLPPIWARRTPNYRLTWFCCVDEGPSGLGFALCHVPSLSSGETGTLLLHPQAGQEGGAGPTLHPRPTLGCPSPSSAAPWGVLEVDAAGCWGEMLFQRVLLGALLISDAVLVQGQGEDGNTDMVPQTRERRRKPGGTSGFYFNILLKRKTRSI